VGGVSEIRDYRYGLLLSKVYRRERDNYLLRTLGKPISFLTFALEHLHTAAYEWGMRH
jgi:hypothetical protein